MPKTVQIRDLDDETYRGLSLRAAEAGVSVPEFLRQEAERIARRPSMVEWLHRTERSGAPVRTSDVVEALDSLRGEWPHAGR
jgi:antitoxin FitA